MGIIPSLERNVLVFWALHDHQAICQGALLSSKSSLLNMSNCGWSLSTTLPQVSRDNLVLWLIPYPLCFYWPRYVGMPFVQHHLRIGTPKYLQAISVHYAVVFYNVPRSPYPASGLFFPSVEPRISLSQFRILGMKIPWFLSAIH